MKLKLYDLTLSSKDLDIDSFLEEDSIKNIHLIPILESLDIKKRGNSLIIHGTLDEANAAILDLNLKNYLDAVLDDVSNQEVGAKQHREIKAIESCIDSVTDANVKQSLQCILNYIKLLHEE